MKKERIKARAIIGNKETMKDFLMSEALDLFSSNSSEPSKTMSINPIVPKIGRSEVRSGILIPTKSENCFIPKPNSNNKITEGTFVFADVKSKT